MAAACLLSTLALSGCKTIEGWFSNNSATVQAATTLAVGETILSQKTPAAEAATAAKIISIAGKVSADATSAASVVTLVAMAEAEVRKLGNPQEVLAGETLLTALQPILVQRVGSGLLDANAVVDVQQFCSWVIAAATPYTSQ